MRVRLRGNAGLALAKPRANLKYELTWHGSNDLCRGLVLRSMPSALDALTLLKAGGLNPGDPWRQAHEICQGREGHPEFDWVHALCHAIEGDRGNAEYWYRRAGQKPYSASLELEWQHIHNCLAEADSARH